MRVWTNPNPALNEFLEHVTFCVTEGSILQGITQICGQLTSDGPGFNHFENQLNIFLDRDMY